MFLKEVTYVHQGSIYLYLKKIQWQLLYYEILLQFKITAFYFDIFFKTYWPQVLNSIGQILIYSIYVDISCIFVLCHHNLDCSSTT